MSPARDSEPCASTDAGGAAVAGDACQDYLTRGYPLDEMDELVAVQKTGTDSTAADSPTCQQDSLTRGFPLEMEEAAVQAATVSPTCEADPQNQSYTLEDSITVMNQARDMRGMPAMIPMMATGPAAYTQQDMMAGMPATVPMIAGSAAWPQAKSAERQLMPADAVEVLTAVESLYIDELKPYGRILRKRLAEHAVLAGRGAVVIGIQNLKQVCEQNPLLTVQPEEGGEWSVLLKGRASTFIDVYSPIDIYPPSLWTAADAYFRSLDDTNMVLPGGRYSCARVLVSRCLPFLAGRSLGQVCHIVQLAISQKKLLGYLHGAVVPYACSQSMVKERCAEWQRPCTNSGDSAVKVADWEAVRSILEKIIEGMPPGAESIPLSNLKRVFRSRYGVELSETSLGYSKLSALFQDPRLHDLCSVRLQGHGYVVEPRHLQQPEALAGTEPVPQLRSPTKTAVPSAISIADSLGAPETRLGQGLKEAKDAAAAAAAVASRARPTPLTLEDIMVTQQSTAPGLPPPPPITPAELTAVAAANEVASLFPPTPSPFSPTPSPNYGLTLPRLLGNSQNSYVACHLPKQLDSPEYLQSYLGKQPQSPPLGASVRLQAMMEREAAVAAEAAARMVAQSQALQYEMESCYNAAAAAAAASMTSPWMRPLTPGALGNVGFRVQNPFISAAMPPPAPLGAESFVRQTSLPRSMGQERLSPISPSAFAAPR